MSKIVLRRKKSQIKEEKRKEFVIFCLSKISIYTREIDGIDEQIIVRC